VADGKRRERLGDFTAGPRTLGLAALALMLGIFSAYVATALLALIAFFTNLFFYQRLSFEAAAPAGHSLGLLGALVPVVGCLIIGVMARYGSERIRGHGIPEALEAILIRGSRIQPRVALLKPISSAISIGSGGPFGAEGPIIMTGGAFGSILAQLLRLTAAERKTLLVAGAAAGMSATFASPVAAVFLAVELLLFELKPRSLIPVALASIAGAATRRHLLGAGPLFPIADIDLGAVMQPNALAWCAVVGLLAGGLSATLTAAVYAAEDAFARLRLHWMWWPALGGVVVGLGGLVCPEALGVGYDQIQAMLGGGARLGPTLRLMAVKAGIWAVSLGSGTSGGVLAPLLIMGSALGVVESHFLPAYGAGFWPLVSMAAILAGTMRAPLTALVFAIELTGRFGVALPILTAGIVAHTFTVLILKRSILTEKVARRGYHVSREYAIDPLEILFVREVMRAEVVVLPGESPIGGAAELLGATARARAQRLFPITDARGGLIGVATRGDIESAGASGVSGATIASIARTPIVAMADEPVRAAIHRMAESGVSRLPVVDRSEPPVLLGLITLKEALKARARHLEEERRRERVLPLAAIIPIARLLPTRSVAPPDRKRNTS